MTTLVPKEENGFDDAHRLIGYMELHVDTPRALVRFDHLVYLAYLAGWDISTIKKEDLEEAVRENRFISLHSYNSNLVKSASERLEKGLIPKNWFEELDTVLRNNGNPVIAHFAHTVHQE